MRATLNLHTWRPCDTVETAVAWKCALSRVEGPSALALSRQTLPHQVGAAEHVADIQRGAYVLVQEEVELDVIVIATGSEVALAVEAADRMANKGRGIRVVSMPCAEYSKRRTWPTVSGVAQPCSGSSGGRGRPRGLVVQMSDLMGAVGMTSFGESAPGAVDEALGFSVDTVSMPLRM